MVRKYTEIITVNVEVTEREKMSVVIQGSVIAIAQIDKRFYDSIQLYENNGYTIISKNKEKLSFVATRDYEEDED
ncbi:MAG: hypothetical protein MUW56_06750 [Chryseobacterium sp.]|uniref:hypothetical protein n=1 Tax=Chryseobacterium sp. TaxID=1871047 RepID=UPI0025BE5D9A|nr:hypothetical protein [Chryseobacterium sp.]MCJ7933331.1 hypothetical protein [Chryseobacterium sp.]